MPLKEACSKTQIFTVEPNRKDLRLIERQLIDGKKFGKAFYLLNQKIKNNPKDSYAYFLKGLTFHRMAYKDLGKYRTMLGSNKNFKAALDCYNQAWNLGFRTAQLYYHRGECYLNLGNSQKALKDLNQSLKINPGRDWVWATRAMTYNRMGKKDLAIADIKKALKINKKRTTNYAKLAAIYESNGQIDKAIQACGKAITMSPKWYPAYLKRALLFDKKKDTVKAQADLNRVLELDPGNAAALALRGRLNARQGQLEQATIDLNEAREINKEVLGDKGKKVQFGAKEARSMFVDLERKSLKLAKFNPSREVLYDLGVARFGLGKWQESKSDFKKVLATAKSTKGSGKTELYSAAFAALATRSMGNKKESTSILYRSLASRKEKSLAHDIVRFLMGGSSAQYLIKEAQSKEDISRVRFFIGAHLRRKGKLDKARRHLIYGLNHGSDKVDEFMLSVIELDRVLKAMPKN